MQRRPESADEFVPSADDIDQSQRCDPVQQSNCRSGDTYQTITRVEGDKSGCRDRNSSGSRTARAETRQLDGYIATGANYEGRHRHESRSEVNDVEKRPLLAKRHTDSIRACRTHRRINSLECRSQELFKRAKHRLVRRCGRSQRSYGADNWRAATCKTFSFA